MDKWVGKVALVTGASSGIGAAVAAALFEHGMHVVGCARNEQKLKEVGQSLQGKGSFTAVKCDVTQEASILSMFQEVTTKYGGIDVLINNAGLNIDTTLLDGNTYDWKTLMDTNVMGVGVVAREGFKAMQAKGANDGYIVTIGSLAGFGVAPAANTHLYSASKFAARALTDGLRHEVRAAGTQIRVTHLSPGLVETNFRCSMVGQEAAKVAYSQIRNLQPKDIADGVVYVLGTPPHVQVTELTINTTDPYPAHLAQGKKKT